MAERTWKWDDREANATTFTQIGGVGYKPYDGGRGYSDYETTSATIRTSKTGLMKLETTQYAECVILTPALARALAHALIGAADVLESKQR